MDEINAHYAAETLSNKNILERLVADKPGLKDKVLNFFKSAFGAYKGDVKLQGAAKKLYNQYKKLFDEFSARNHGMNSAENVSKINSGSMENYMISEDFYKQIEKWDGNTIGFSFVVGRTSEALKSAGVPDKQIRWDASKIKTILAKHDGMTMETVRQIPDLLEHPVVVIDSKQNNDSRIVMGDLYDANGKIVTAVLLLTPTSKKGNQLDLIKVASAQGRGHIESLFKNDDGSLVNIRYYDKKRIQNWLNANRLQLPLHSFNLDSVADTTDTAQDRRQEVSATDNSIPHISEKSNGFEKKSAESSSESSNYSNSGKRAMFAGEGARGADVQKLSKAKELAEHGEGVLSIRRQTGWFRGIDGKWRFEIDDKDMQVDTRGAYSNNPDIRRYTELVDKVYFNEGATEAEREELRTLDSNLEGVSLIPKTLGETIKHEALFNSYPNLKNIPIIYTSAENMPNRALGAYGFGEILLSEELRKNKENMKAVLIHEIQHIVQETEGFSPGTNRDAAGGYDAYFNTAGEIEARDAANRRNLTDEQRKNTEPDIYRSDAVLAENESFWASADDSVYDSETASISEQIKHHQEELNKLGVVASASVPTRFESKQKARIWAIESLKSSGYQVDKQGFGTVYFNPNDINNGLNYADTDAEKAAFAVLNKVIKRGIVIEGHFNHKGRKKQTITIAAPVELNGIRGNMAVVVNKNGNHYYAHRILLPDGRTFTFSEIKEEARREPYRGVAENSSLANTTSLTSNDSIPHISEKSNTLHKKSAESSSVKRYNLAEKLKTLEKYTDEETKSIEMTKSFKVARSYSEVHGFIRNSANYSSERRLFLGKLNNVFAEKIEKSTGVEVKGKSIALSSSDIAHIFKNHGVADAEKSRGQVPITYDNIETIIETLISPDEVIRDDGKNFVGLIFKKEVNGHISAVAVVSQKKKTLTLKSAWIQKEKQSTSPTVDVQAPTSTSETRQRIKTTSDISIPQTEEKSNRKFKDIFSNDVYGRFGTEKDTTTKFGKTTLYEKNEGQVESKNEGGVTWRDVEAHMIKEGVFGDGDGEKGAGREFAAELIEARGLPRHGGTVQESIGNRKQREANYTRNKVYTKQKVLKIVDSLKGVKELSVKTRAEVSEALWQVMNESTTYEQRLA